MFATKGHKLSEMEIEALAKKKDVELKERARMCETARIEAYIQRFVELVFYKIIIAQTNLNCCFEFDFFFTSRFGVFLSIFCIRLLET